jgi:glycosyltransferase involved in cell wall biosynthesis
MTAYNHEAFIGDAIISVLNQTYQNFELIIINDGSIDQTLQVINKFKDARIKVINQHNQGPSIAFNNGIELSSGKWIAFMSGDDICLPNRLEVQINEASKYSELVIIFSHINFINEKNENIKSPFPVGIFNAQNLNRNQLIHHLFFNGNFLAAPTAFIPKEVFKTEQKLDPALFQLQDFELWCRLSKKFDFKIIQQPLLSYRVHSSNLSGNNVGKKFAMVNEYSLVARNFFENLSDENFKGVFATEIVKSNFLNPTQRKIEEGLLFLASSNKVLKLEGFHKLYEILKNKESSKVALIDYGISEKKFWNLLGENQIFQEDIIESPFLNRKSVRNFIKVINHIDQSRFLKPMFSKLFVVYKTLIAILKFFKKILSIQFYIFNFYYFLGLILKKTLPIKAISYFRHAFSIDSTNMNLNFKILEYYYENSKIELIDFFIKCLFLNKNFFDKVENKLIDKIIKFIELEFGSYFAQQLVFKYRLKISTSLESKSKGEIESNLTMPYNFIAEVVDIFQYTQTSKDEIIKIGPSSKCRFNLPKVFDQNQHEEVHELDTPESWIVKLKNVEVVGGFCVLKDKKIIIYEPASHPGNCLVSGFRKYLVGVKGRFDRASFNFKPTKTIKYKTGILLSGRCSTNYYHWLIEYLPKFLEIDSQESLKTIPIVVDENMPIQHFQSLMIMNNGQREIIGYDHKSILKFETLIIPSVASFIPDRFDIPYWKSGVFSEKHLLYIKEKIISEVQKYKFDFQKYPEKIYLSRKNVSARSLVNESEIEARFTSNGFQKVYLETLTFYEQVLIMQNAKYIAGPSGAGLSNLLFCSKGAKVISFTSERNKGFCNFANLARLSGLEFIYITGENVNLRNEFRSDEDYAHSSFEISVSKLDNFLKFHI